MDSAHGIGSQSNFLRSPSEKVFSSYIENVYSSSVVGDSKRSYYRFLQKGGSGQMY